MGLDFDTRGGRVDETIEVIKRLFTEEEIAHEGECFQFQPVGFQPKPVQRPWPPMLIGGDSPAARRRAALLGDGWIPMEQTLESLPKNLQQISAIRATASRTGSFDVTLPVSVTSLDDVKRYEAAGATRVIVTLDPRDPDAVSRFGDEIIAKL